MGMTDNGEWQTMKSDRQWGIPDDRWGQTMVNDRQWELHTMENARQWGIPDDRWRRTMLNNRQSGNHIPWVMTEIEDDRQLAMTNNGVTDNGE